MVQVSQFFSSFLSPSLVLVVLAILSQAGGETMSTATTIFALLPNNFGHIVLVSGMKNW